MTVLTLQKNVTEEIQIHSTVWCRHTTHDTRHTYPCAMRNDYRFHYAMHFSTWWERRRRNLMLLNSIEIWIWVDIPSQSSYQFRWICQMLTAYFRWCSILDSDERFVCEMNEEVICRYFFVARGLGIRKLNNRNRNFRELNIYLFDSFMNNNKKFDHLNIQCSDCEHYPWAMGNMHFNISKITENRFENHKFCFIIFFLLFCLFVIPLNIFSIVVSCALCTSSLCIFMPIKRSAHASDLGFLL